MMVADTSAVMAILLDEPERLILNEAMMEDGEVLISTASVMELLVVTLQRSDELYGAALGFLRSPFIRLVPFDESQMWAAGEASRRYGRGSGAARLNFGDTFSYALAATRGLPLLFKGDDFTLTDIVAVRL
jgi:ribonuclease VapC